MEPFRLGDTLSCALCRLQQLVESDAVKHFGAQPVEYGKANTSPVLGRIVMHTEGALAKGRVDNIDIRSATGRHHPG